MRPVRHERALSGHRSSWRKEVKAWFLTQRVSFFRLLWLCCAAGSRAQTTTPEWVFEARSGSCSERNCLRFSEQASVCNRGALASHLRNGNFFPSASPPRTVTYSIRHLTTFAGQDQSKRHIIKHPFYFLGRTSGRHICRQGVRTYQMACRANRQSVTCPPLLPGHQILPSATLGFSPSIVLITS